MLVNTPGFEDAVRGARAAGAPLGIGLHLNLVQGRPIEQVPSLTNPRSGEFYPLPVLLARALTGRVDADEVAAECGAQIARLRAAGIAITHIDSHQHAHAIPGLWRPIAAAAHRAGIPAARWPAESLRILPTRITAQAKKAAVHIAWRAARTGRRGVAPALRHPDHFIGVSLQGGRHVLPRLLRVLDALRPGTTELMVHPGHAGPLLAAIDDYTWQRQRELEALMSAALRARLRRGDIELVHFGALA